MEIIATLAGATTTEVDGYDAIDVTAEDAEDTVVAVFLPVDGPDALAVELTKAAQLPAVFGGDVIHLQFRDHERDDVDLLCGVSEFADMRGVARQRASQLSQRRGFPEPVGYLRAGPVWTVSSIRRWMRDQSKHRGRARRRPE